MVARSITQKKKFKGCYNCGELGHKHANCPYPCHRCGGNHSFVRCTAGDDKELREFFDSMKSPESDVLVVEDVRKKLAGFKLVNLSAHDVFRAASTKNFGEMTWDEFLAYANERKDFMRHLFEEFDRSGSGSINRHEFKAALEHLRMQPNEDEVRAMIALIDRPTAGGKCPPNGKIEWPEFRDFFLLVVPTGRFLDFSPMADQWLHVAQDELGVHMGTESKGSKASKAQTAMIGGFSMGFSRSCVAPLERLRMQMIVDGSKYTSTWQCFRSIFEKEGLRGYWRGNTINMIRIIPQGAVAFVAKDFYKEKLGGENPSSLALAAASMASGMTCMTAIYPLDLVRGRVTTTPGAYRGMFDGLYQIASKEGPRALYKGLGPANAWAVPYYGAQFYTYDSCKKLYHNYIKPNYFPDPPGTVGSKQTNPLIGLCMGAVAGAAGTTAAFPFELIRRVLQVQGIGGRPVEYKGVFDAGMGIYKKRGVSGLFSGLKANLIKSPIGTAIAFWSFEALNNTIHNSEFIGKWAK